MVALLGEFHEPAGVVSRDEARSLWREVTRVAYSSRLFLTCSTTACSITACSSVVVAAAAATDRSCIFISSLRALCLGGGVGCVVGCVVAGGCHSLRFVARSLSEDGASGAVWYEDCKG